MTSVLTETAEGVCRITLNEPDNKNALSVTLVDGLLAAMSDAVLDPVVRAVVVTNAGGVFCAGADLNRAQSDDSSAPGDGLVQLLETILDSPKPMIALINGHCMGGGVGLAAAFDISIARRDVRFGFTEARLGVAPAIISTVCLPKMRLADAKELFLRSKRFKATKAAKVGLITRAVEGDELEWRLEEIIDDVVAGGPVALAACKQLISEVPQLKRAEAFEWTNEVSASLFASDEATEGIAAFLERRNPSWIPEKPAPPTQ